MTSCTLRISPPNRRLIVDVFFVCLYMTVAFALLSTWLYDTSYAFSPAKASLFSAADTPAVALQDRFTIAQASPGSADEDVRKQAEEAERARDTFLRQERVLIRRGEIQFELSTFYSMDTQEHLLRVPGGNSLLVKSKNRQILANFLGRYGLIDSFELVMGIPFLVHTEQSNELQIGGLKQTLDATGVGDLSGSLRYQLWQESASLPDIVLELNVQSTTGDDLRWTGDDVSLGTGAWEVGGGVTLVKTLDPVVFFGRFDYTHRFGNLGDVFSLSLGTGFSLNDRVSFNMQVIGTFVEQSEVKKGMLVDNSSLEIFSVQFAVTILLSEHLFVEPVINFGLSDDATDVVVGFNMPFQL